MKKLVMAMLFVVCLASALQANAAGEIRVEFYGGTECWDCYNAPSFIHTPPPVVYQQTRQVEVYSGSYESTYRDGYYYDSSAGYHDHHKHHKKHKKYKHHKKHRRHKHEYDY